MRKTRTIFEDLIGNDSIKKKLYSELSLGTLSHAYIIEGKKGSGRRTAARLVAAALSCENAKNNALPLPCTTCASCKKILTGKSPDVIMINREDKASIGVDTIRFLKNDIYVVPNDLDYKVYIIEDAELMNDNAQNAFLLSLEEPPAFVKFFLICEDSASLLETIRSRAQLLRTELIQNDTIDDYISSRYESAARMKRTDLSSYRELIMASKNTIGTAIELLDEKNFKDTLEIRTLAREFIDMLIRKKTGELLVTLLKRFDKKREELISWINTTLTALRDLIVLQKSETAPLIFYHDRDEALSLTDESSISTLLSAYDALTRAAASLDGNANLRLTIVKLFSDTDTL